jgi:hypothetical protein
MPRSSCLEPAVDTWTTNVVRGYSLFLLPITALFFQTFKQSIATKLLYKKYGDSVPDEMDEDTAKELDLEFRRAFSVLGKQASENIGGVVALIMEYGYGHLQELFPLLSIVALPGENIIEKGVDAMLYALVTGAWTSFESLASELWEAALNAHPRTLAYLRGTASDRFKVDSGQKSKPTDQSKVVKIDDLEKYDYAIADKMGTIYIDGGKTSFDSLNGIRVAYAQAFWEDHNAIDEALNDQGLDVVSQVRHVIVHCAGNVDEDYLTKTRSLSNAPKAEKGQPLLLDGEIVAAQLTAMLECGSKLVMAVDEWLLKH